MYLYIRYKVFAKYEDKAKVLQRIASAHVKNKDLAMAIEWYVSVLFYIFIHVLRIYLVGAACIRAVSSV